MKIKMWLMAFLFLMLFSSQALAGGFVLANQGAKVQGLRIINGYAGAENYVKIKVDKNLYTTPPACSTNAQDTFAIDLSTAMGKNVYSLLQLAYATGKPVTLWGTGNCTILSDHEDLMRIDLE